MVHRVRDSKYPCTCRCTQGAQRRRRDGASTLRERERRRPLRTRAILAPREDIGRAKEVFPIGQKKD